mmetsp:Transcript_14283/g.42113  ORF Transcript_14283/g.42113 Transcript_14283/m.42113 type:complete len:210 (+) Transcript_14283:30-659(+)
MRAWWQREVSPWSEHRAQWGGQGCAESREDWCWLTPEHSTPGGGAWVLCPAWSRSLRAQQGTSRGLSACGGSWRGRRGRQTGCSRSTLWDTMTEVTGSALTLSTCPCRNCGHGQSRQRSRDSTASTCSCAEWITGQRTGICRGYSQSRHRSAREMCVRRTSGLGLVRRQESTLTDLTMSWLCTRAARWFTSILPMTSPGSTQGEQTCFL